MLDIKNISEGDKLFNFMSGLQARVQAKLRRHGEKYIHSTMVVVEGLVDYRMSSPNPNTYKRKSVNGKKGKTKEGKKKNEGKKKKEGGTNGKDHYQNKEKSQQGYFICGSSHHARNCLKKEKISAIISQDAEDVDDGSSWVNPLHLLTAILREKQYDFKSLIYVAVQVNGKNVRAMLDTSATNNFMAQQEANRLGLNLFDRTSTIKAVNSRPMPGCGTTEMVLKVGNWKGKCRMMVVPLDDFDLILRMNLFMKAKVMVIPYLKGIVIED